MANPFMAKLPPLTRVAEPHFEPEAAEVYDLALRALEEEGVRFALGGALALNAYTGIWRDTKDLDVFVRPQDAGRTLAAFRAAGMETETVYESWLGKGWIGQVFVDVIWRNANGLFPVTDAWFDSPGRMDVLGRDVPVVPLEELVVSKMMVCGRYRFDGADILHLFHQAGHLVDWERLERLAGEHVGLLLAYMHMYRWGYPGWRDRVPDSAFERYEQAAEQAESSFGAFRARLLDIQSFSVDVEEWDMPDPHRQALSRIFGDAEGRQ